MIGRLARFVSLACGICMLVACQPIQPPVRQLIAAPDVPAADTAPNDAIPPPHPLKLTILYDNTITDARLTADWGFAALVEYDGDVLLFDTGAGPILLDNMEQLGIDPARIEMVVLSHEHDDHVGGLQALLDKGLQLAVYVPSTFSTYFKERIGAQTELVEVTAPLEIRPGIYATGSADGMREQALLAETASGSVLLVGCAHPGVVELVRKAEAIVPAKVALLTGGFHLASVTDESVLNTMIDDLRALGVAKIMPAHCTGDLASAMFKEAYGEAYSDAGAGRVVTLDDQ